MPRRIATLMGVALLAGPYAARPAEPVTIESPAAQVALVELYTSEGCSSCPAADQWLSRLEDDPRLWAQVVPVAFHVDYWDYIGWRDRFASPRFSKRQREYARYRHLSTVYTPGFVVAGEEWRGWFRRPDLDVSGAPVVGALRARLDGREVHMQFEPSAEVPPRLEFHVAVLGFDLETAVAAGENRGRRLQHDFVVLGYNRADATLHGGYFVGDTPVPTLSQPAERKALAVWISTQDDPRPIQAAGSWIP